MTPFFSSLSSLIILVSVPLIGSAENKQQLKKTRWLNEIDKKLFCDSKTHTIYTPYSTLSVKKFSYEKKVFIDQLDYQMLLANALQRTVQRKDRFSANMEKLTASLSNDNKKTKRQGKKQKARLDLLARAYSRAGMRQVFFESMQASNLLRQHDDEGHIQISERSLMHLLQWTYGFHHEHGPDGSDLIIILSKDKRSFFSADGTLKKFINNTSAHEQGAKYV